MKHIKTVSGACLKKSAKTGGCGECQASCQSACKTSCTVANQSARNNALLRVMPEYGRKEALLWQGALFFIRQDEEQRI